MVFFYAEFEVVSSLPELLIGVIYGIVSSLFAAAIIFGVKKLYERSKVAGSAYSGYWQTDIYNEEGEVAKVDFMLLKHNRKTGEFTGKLKRTLPGHQTFNERICKGVFTKDVMLTVAWSKINALSYGAGFLVMTSDFTYSGVYLKHDKSSGKIVSQKLVKTKLTSRDDIARAKKLFS